MIIDHDLYPHDQDPDPKRSQKPPRFLNEVMRFSITGVFVDTAGGVGYRGLRSVGIVRPPVGAPN